MTMKYSEVWSLVDIGKYQSNFKKGLFQEEKLDEF